MMVLTVSGERFSQFVAFMEDVLVIVVVVVGELCLSFVVLVGKKGKKTRCCNAGSWVSFVL